MKPGVLDQSDHRPLSLGSALGERRDRAHGRRSGPPSPSIRVRCSSNHTYSSVKATTPTRQAEQHEAVDLGVEIGVQRSWPPGAGCATSARDQCTSGITQHGEQADHRGALGPLMVRAVESAHGEIADVGDEEQCRRGQAGVPLPEDAPGESAPERSDDQREPDERPRRSRRWRRRGDPSRASASW